MNSDIIELKKGSTYKFLKKDNKLFINSTFLFSSSGLSFSAFSFIPDIIVLHMPEKYLIFDVSNIDIYEDKSYCVIHLKFKYAE